jgi:hypothetical protein
VDWSFVSMLFIVLASFLSLMLLLFRPKYT